MNCKIKDCGRDATYKKDQVCQKHYFRFMRYGTYDLKRKARYRISNPAGYQFVHETSHELVDSRGYVAEHRFVLFNNLGHSITECEKCKRSWCWGGGKSCHVDHIDSDITNNHISNLRPLCNSCNTRRGRKPEHEYDNCLSVEYNGEVKSIKEWSKEDFVPVEHYTIRRRLNNGWSVHDALNKKPISGRAYRNRIGEC